MKEQPQSKMRCAALLRILLSKAVCVRRQAERGGGEAEGLRGDRHKVDGM